MPEISAYELAHRMTTARPQREDAMAARVAFEAAAPDADVPSDDATAASIVPAMRAARDVAAEGTRNSALVVASSFLLAGTSDQERDSLDPGLMARHVLALAGHREADGAEFDLRKAAEAGGIEADRVPEIRNAVFDASSLSDDQISRLSGGRLFSSPSEEDELFASRVLSSDRASLDDPAARRASMAVEALDVDADGADARRIASSLSRISADGVAMDASVPDLAVRIASDVAAQSRAERLSGDLAMDETSEDAFRIHEAASRDPRMALDLEKESKGLFHEMSRGAMMELRSDMETGANLPDDMARMIRLSAERLESMEAITVKQAVRMDARHAEQGMGI